MKVRLNIKTKNCPFIDYYIDAEFPCAPRVGDIVTANWDRVRDAIIRDGNVENYLEYLSEDLQKRQNLCLKSRAKLSLTQ